MKRLLFVMGLVLTLSSCATMIKGTKDEVSINSTPSGAHVKLSSGHTCTTPCNLSVERKNNVTVTVRKQGYHDHITSMVPTLGGSGVLLGGLIDYGTGAVYDLQPNPLHVNLIPKK